MDLGGFLTITFWAVSSLSLINGSLAPHPLKTTRPTTAAIHLPFLPMDNFPALVSIKIPSPSFCHAPSDLKVTGGRRRTSTGSPPPIKCITITSGYNTFPKKKLCHQFPVTQLLMLPLATRRSRCKRCLRDPWLSVSRLLGVWLFHEQYFCVIISICAY